MRRFVFNQAVVFTAAVGFIAGSVSGDNAITVRGSDSTITLVAELAEAYQDQSQGQVIVEGGGTTKGPGNTLKNEIELAFVQRNLTPDEKDAGLVGFAYARDGVAIIANAKNPVSDLTVEELKNIFAGKTATWEDGNAIVAYTEDPINFSARECFEGLVLEEDSFGPNVSVSQEQSVVDSVIKDVRAIGYVSAIELADRDGLKVLTVNGVGPTFENISDKSYPISRTFSLVSQGQPTDQTKAFIDFVLSKDGQQIVSDAGFLPVGTPKAIKTASILLGN